MVHSMKCPYTCCVKVEVAVCILGGHMIDIHMGHCLLQSIDIHTGHCLLQSIDIHMGHCLLQPIEFCYGSIYCLKLFHKSLFCCVEVVIIM